MSNELEVGVVVVLSVASIWRGYFTAGYPVLSWPMFTAHSAVIAELWVQQGTQKVRVEPYEYVPSHSLSINQRDFELFLTYMRTSGLSVNGYGVAYRNDDQVAFTVKDSRVDS